MKHILIINGSPRPNGNTAKLLKIAMGYLAQKPELTVEYVDISQYSIIPCRGCRSCFKKSGCIIQGDGINALVQKMHQCDGIIIGSPTYASNIPGQLKILIDRSHAVLEQNLIHKYGFILATYENAEVTEVVKTLKKYFLFSGGIPSGYYIGKIAPGQNHNITWNTVINAKIEAFYRALITDQKKSMIETIIHKLVFHIGIKPFILKNRSEYPAILHSWLDKGLIKHCTLNP